MVERIGSELTNSGDREPALRGYAVRRSRAQANGCLRLFRKPRPHVACRRMSLEPASYSGLVCAPSWGSVECSVHAVGRRVMGIDLTPYTTASTVLGSRGRASVGTILCGTVWRTSNVGCLGSMQSPQRCAWRRQGLPRWWQTLPCRRVPSCNFQCRHSKSRGELSPRAPE